MEPIKTLTILQESAFFYLPCITLLGLMVGSFLNVVIVRLPRSLYTGATSTNSTGPSTLLCPRSQCPHCQHTLAIKDNIPLISYFILKGRCRHCQGSISKRYVWVELLTAICTFMITFKFGVSLTTLFSLIFTFSLIVLAFIDIEYLVLPDNITLPTLWLGLLASLIPIFQNSHNAILGAVFGYLSLFIVYWIYKLATRKEGIGYGDFKLTAMLGAWLGWQALPLTIFIASMMGAFTGAYLILIKKQSHNIPIPFGPFLALSGFINLIILPDILPIYLRMQF